ncbi:MAG TPA: hypothetical protein VFL82_10140 [Thermomicrobiales bacterium]|nr:hypothetical protein [Thermomicrobiales bacterium]
MVLETVGQELEDVYGRTAVPWLVIAIVKVGNGRTAVRPYKRRSIFLIIFDQQPSAPGVCPVSRRLFDESGVQCRGDRRHSK